MGYTRRNSNTYCLYKLTFPNGKCYIGITHQYLKERWQCGHGYKAFNGKTSIMDDAIKKYGWENVMKEVLIDYGMTKEEAAEAEKFYIKQFKTNDPKYGYNIYEGGFNPSMPESTKKKISVSRMGKNYGRVGEKAPAYGMRHTEESKRKISEAQRGEKNWIYGKHHTEETKDKIRATHSKICKRVKQYDKDGNLINEFPSIHYAAKATGINRHDISFCLLGRYKTAGKSVWKYAD